MLDGRSINCLLLILFLSVTVLTQEASQQTEGSAQTTAISYQGSLIQSGLPANGTFDIQLSLYDALTGGNLLGIQIRPGVQVTNGTFSVSVNFGNQFNDGVRFIEVQVRPSGGIFTALAPRQQVLSTPYSIHSIKALSADSANTAVTATNAANATNAVNATQLGGVAAANYVQNGTATINAGTQFNINNSRVLAVPNIENTFVGINAGSGNTASTGNTFIGHSAGQTNSSGGSNTFVGARAGRFNTGGSNTAVGYNAGGAMTTGAGNSVVGAGAGDSITTANNNSLFGVSAGQATTTGAQNTMFGAFAGFSNIAGQSNSFFGFEAGRNSTVSFNSFYGYQSGLATTTGGGNAFYGAGTGSDNTTGEDNSFFGVNSGRANTIGNRNTFYGRLSGRFNQWGDNNTFVGFNSGQANTVGNNNTLIGANTDLGAVGLDYASAIGAGASVSENNTIVLGRTADQVRVRGNLLVSGELRPFRTTFPWSREVLYTDFGTSGGSNVCWTFDSGYSAYNIGRCSSSQRYKHEIHSFYLGVDYLKALRPVTFSWNANGNQQIGLIAEEVNAIDPRLATRYEGTVDGVDFSGVTAVVVAAAKEQLARIESLEETVRRQKEEISELRKAVCELRPELTSCR